MDSLTRKKLLLNFFCFAILLVYTVLGGLLLLYFEHDEAIAERKSLLELKRLCIKSTLFKLIKIVNFSNFISILRHQKSRSSNSSTVSEEIVKNCLLGIETHTDLRRREDWNLKNSLLYGFGILTTLGRQLFL